MKMQILVTLLILLPQLIQAQQINIGTNSLNVVFEDALLPSETRQIISEDLSKTFGFATTVEQVFAETDSSGVRHLKDVVPRYYQREVWNGLDLFSQGNSNAIRVATTLSDFYKTAAVKLAPFSNEVAAATAFVSMVNTGGVTRLNFEQKRNLMRGYPDGDDPRTESDIEETAVLCGNLILTQPSILSFDQDEYYIPGKNVLGCRVLARSKADPNLMKVLWLAYFDDIWSLVFPY